MPELISSGKFPLPCFDREQDNRTCSMDSETADSGIDTCVATLALICVASVRAKRPN